LTNYNSLSQFLRQNLLMR